MTPHSAPDLLGRGSFGVVTSHWDNGRGERVALKTFLASQADLSAELVREVVALRQLRHRHIVALLGTHANGAFKCAIALEDGGIDLLRATHAGVVDSPTRVLHGMASGVAHMHACGWMHRDLKLSNVLYAPDGRVRLCDLGSARVVLPGRTYTPLSGTLIYLAPEDLLSEGVYDERVDVWALGCVFAHMLLGAPLFAATTCVGMLFEIFRVVGTDAAACFSCSKTYEHYEPRLLPAFRGTLDAVCRGLDDADSARLLRRLLCANPHRRWTAQAVVDAAAECVSRRHRTRERERARKRTRADYRAAAEAEQEPAIAEAVPEARATLTSWSSVPSTASWSPSPRSPPWRVECDESGRRLLVWWVLDHGVAYDMDVAVVLSAIAVVDEVLSSSMAIRRHELRLLGCASLLLTSLVMEVSHLRPKDLVQISDGAHTASDIKHFVRRLVLSDEVGVRVRPVCVDWHFTIATLLREDDLANDFANDLSKDAPAPTKGEADARLARRFARVRLGMLASTLAFGVPLTPTDDVRLMRACVAYARGEGDESDEGDEGGSSGTVGRIRAEVAWLMRKKSIVPQTVLGEAAEAAVRGEEAAEPLTRCGPA